MAFCGSLNTGGRTISMTGTGAADFGTGAMTMDVSAQLGPGRSFEVRELLVDDTMYVGMVIDGQSLKQMTGRDWIKMPTPIGCASSGDATWQPLAGSEASGNGTITIDFRNYGTQVDINPPASNDVMSEQQYQNFANSAGGGGTSATSAG